MQLCDSADQKYTMLCLLNMAPYMKVFTKTFLLRLSCGRWASFPDRGAAGPATSLRQGKFMALHFPQQPWVSRAGGHPKFNLRSHSYFHKKSGDRVASSIIGGTWQHRANRGSKQARACTVRLRHQPPRTSVPVQVCVSTETESRGGKAVSGEWCRVYSEQFLS